MLAQCSGNVRKNDYDFVRMGLHWTLLFGLIATLCIFLLCLLILYVFEGVFGNFLSISGVHITL